MCGRCQHVEATTYEQEARWEDKETVRANHPAGFARRRLFAIVDVVAPHWRSFRSPRVQTLTLLSISSWGHCCNRSTLEGQCNGELLTGS